MGFTPLLRAQVVQRLPTPTNFREREALELDGFPEYVADVTPQQRARIEELAAQIVRSQDTADPIFEFRVEGFADIARRIANPAERKAMENEISSERANTGFDLLVEALKRKGGDALADKIRKGSRAFGLGSQRLKIPNATTEAQFRRNRRVVFIVRQVTFLPPPPEPEPPPTSVVEDRFSVQLLRAATFTVTVTPGVESLSVGADLEIVDKIDKKVVVFKVTATGGGFGVGPTRAGGSFTNTPGPVVHFKTFRIVRGRNATTIGLKSFEGAVTVFVDGGIGVGSANAGGTLSFSFDALESNGANTNPTVIRVPGGNSKVTPGVSFGEVTVGFMRMVGTPKDQ